jgi:hypothetical protein
MNILSRQTLANGMELIVVDHSRKVAGDRWQIRLVWQAAMPVAAEFFAGLAGEDPAFLAVLREKIGDRLTFSLAREKNFVAEADKGARVEALLQEGLANMLSYFNAPRFPERIFFLRCEEERRAWQLARHYQTAAEGEEDGGPVDFSACFRSP